MSTLKIKYFQACVQWKLFYLNLGFFSVWIWLCHCHLQDVAVPTAGSWEQEWSKPAGSHDQWAAQLLFKHTEHKRFSLFFAPWRLTQRVNLGAHSRAACYHQSSSDHQLVFGCTIKVMFSGLSTAWWIRVFSALNPVLWYFAFLTLDMSHKLSDSL